jgi:hypothetical protein
MVDDHIDIPYPLSITHMPYRYPDRYPIDVRTLISISHIDLPYRYGFVSCHSGRGPQHTSLASRHVIGYRLTRVQETRVQVHDDDMAGNAARPGRTPYP